MTPWEEVFDEVAELAFSRLGSDEVLNLNFCAEDTRFLRFNRSRVRQVSAVAQATLELELVIGQQHESHTINLSRNSALNRAAVLDTLGTLQAVVPTLPDDPYVSALEHHGTSRVVNTGQLPAPEDVLAFVAAELQDIDLAGLFMAGPVHRANANSLGQRHWFSASSFVFDYSLYSARQKAVKGAYGGADFDPASLRAVIGDSLQALEVMDRERKVLAPGKYRCYLAPAAVHEIMGMLNWHALSAGAHRRGECSLTELVDGTRMLSPKFTLDEDYSLGLSPRFNERGEVFAEKLPLIVDGQLENLFVSSQTAKEYGLPSNFASEDEAPRSPVIATGTLARQDILSELDTGLYLSNLHYLNWSDKTRGRVTGMTRFGCLWVENGEVVGPIADLRFDETLYHLFGTGLLELTDFTESHVEVMTYDQRHVGGKRAPGMLVQDMSFTL
ncbi:MAG: TldD/PmbA family protein [Gammaproteobacteria bacterium]|nr:TldD/PmbA family protein [Gammaproteobacteria bacterium]